MEPLPCANAACSATCEHCGAAFVPSDRRQRYCHVNCRVASFRRRQGPRQRTAPAMEGFVCEACGVAFRSVRARAFCSPACRPSVTSKKRGMCSLCGDEMWGGGRGALPIGQAVCRPCRQDRAKPPEQARPRRESCAHCHGPMPADDLRRRTFCSDGCLRRAYNARGSGGRSRQSRGYDAAHYRLRRALLPLAWGSPCSLCGEVMLEGDDVHLDHTEDRSGYRGFSHARCNVLDGARRGGAATRAKRLAGVR